jgi:two-component system, NarL family, sensor histidine kinase DesK
MEDMTTPRSGHPESASLLAVFRSQAREAKVALVLCWAVLASMVIRSVTGVPEGDALSRYLTVTLVDVPGLLLLVHSQLVACRGGGPLRLPWVPPALVGLALVPLAWGAVPMTIPYAFAVVLLLYRPQVAVPVVAGLAVGVLALVQIPAGLGVFGFVLEIIMLATILVAVTVLAIWIDRLHLTREVLARRRVDIERDRVARDLHDLMGRTLVAASLRNQAAVQSLGTEESELAAGLDGLHETLSVGQVQLRALTSGPIVSSLENELVGAKVLCGRVSIDLRVEIDGQAPGPIDSLLGSIVRENITNVLKHTRASWCCISVQTTETEAVVSVSSDGVVVGRDRGAHAESRVARAVAAAGGDSSEVFSPLGDKREFVARIPVGAPARSVVAR